MSDILTCPHCRNEVTDPEVVWTRRTFPAPTIDRGIVPVTVRYPLRKCPICREAFGDRMSMAVLGQAAHEFINRDIERWAKRKAIGDTKMRLMVVTTGAMVGWMLHDGIYTLSHLSREPEAMRLYLRMLSIWQIVASVLLTALCLLTPWFTRVMVMSFRRTGRRLHEEQMRDGRSKEQE